MVKAKINVTIDNQLVELARLREINVSKLLNEALKARLEIPDDKDNPNPLDEIKRLEEETTARLNAIKIQKQFLEKEEQKKKGIETFYSEQTWKRRDGE